MARRGLSLDLRAALREAIKTGKAVQRGNVMVETPRRQQPVDLLVEPLGPNATDPFSSCCFETHLSDRKTGNGTQAAGRTGDSGLIEELERELRGTPERLQGTIEEYETAVEELKSFNDELQSINEELQSVNGELQTVNSKLTGKIDELHRANSDLRNVFDSTQLATVFLDSKLVIRSFTRAATTLQFDLQRPWPPLTDIVNNLEDQVPLRRYRS